MHVLTARFKPVQTTDGRVHAVKALGARRDDGLWEGRLAFIDDEGGVLTTGRETTQPNLNALEYWARGLTPVYLEGALARAEAATRTEPPLAEHESAGSPEEMAEETSGEPPDGVAAPPRTEPFTVLRVEDDAGHVLSVDSVLRGRVVALDAEMGEIKLRAGAHLISVLARPADVQALRPGQEIAVKVLPAAS
jgi:hypothetical protein